MHSSRATPVTKKIPKEIYTLRLGLHIGLELSVFGWCTCCLLSASVPSSFPRAALSKQLMSLLDNAIGRTAHISFLDSDVFVSMFVRAYLLCFV